MSKEAKTMLPSELKDEDVIVAAPDVLGKGDRLSKIHHAKGSKLVVKLRIKVERVQELSSRHVILFARVKTEVRNLLLGLDDSVVRQTCSNVDPWFIDEDKKPRIRPNMVHEYFQPSLSVTKTGTLGKFHLLNNQIALKEGSEYDVLLHLYGVRFLKTSFYLTWKLDRAIESVGKTEFSREYFLRDEDAEVSEAEEEEVTPLPSEAEAIRESLRVQAKSIADLLEQKKHATESQMQVLLNLYEKLSTLEGTIEGADIRQFNDVHGLLQQIGTEL